MKCRYSKRKRLACFLVGLALSGIGVAYSTSPGLGTSPISSMPYVMTFVVPLSFGVWTVIINAFFVLMQIAILKKKFQWFQLSQILAACILGFFIDIGMWLAQLYVPEHYFLRILEQLAGSAIIAVGIACELVADVTYMPGEGLVKAISQHWELNFGKVKMGFDLSLVALAVLASLCWQGEIKGLREGTILAAFAVGFIIKQIHAPFRNVKKLLIKA